MKTFEEKYNLLVKLVITANRMNNVYNHCMNLKKLIAEEDNPINLHCDSWQLHEATKDLKELREEYHELRNTLDKAAGCTDVWAIVALDDLTSNLR